MRIDSEQTRGREPHAKCAGPCLRAVHHRRIHTATGGFAQRTGRKEQAVAETALILDRNLEISLQAVMLQSIVAENHVAASVGREQRAGGGGAICADPHRAPRTPGKQQRLVADLRGIVTLAHRAGSGVGPAVPPAENSGAQSLRAQGFDEREDQRGFPCAPDGQVSDDDHRNVKSHRGQRAYAKEQTTHGYQQTKDKAQGKQQHRHGAQPVPVTRGKASGKKGGPGGLHTRPARYFVDCSTANTTWPKPAWRAASMTRITDW